MKTQLKWLLAIMGGLLIVAVIVAAGFLAWNWFNSGNWMEEVRGISPLGRQRSLPWREMPMFPDRDFSLQRIRIFTPLRMIAGSLICMGVVALIVVGVVVLFRGLRRPTPVAPQAAASPVVMAPAGPVLESTCPSCARPIQPDWSHCPYCGTSLANPPNA
jgi:hypothetical protein